jgi:hypothetical protein
MEKYLLSEDLAVWFGTKKKPKGSKQPKGPWVNICRKDKDGKHPPCGRSDSDKGGYPKCRAAGVAGKMSDAEKKSACDQKRRAEKKDTQTGKGQKPVMTSHKKKTKNESIDRLVKRIVENLNSQNNFKISEELNYHIKNKISLTENVFRYGSEKYFEVINEARELKSKGFNFDEFDIELLETDMGKFGYYKNEVVPLDFPILETLTESEYQGKKVELGKPKKGGTKKYYVYVRNPKTGKVIKVSYGYPGMTANWNDPKARSSFAARHRCEEKKDRTKPGYWACRAHKDFGNNVSGRYW